MLKELYNETRQHMQKSLEALEHHLTTMRTGRANPAILNNIKVEYYGSTVPLSQVGTVSSPDPPTGGAVVGSQHAQGDREGHPRLRPGSEPHQQGRCAVHQHSPLTEERRRDLVKSVKHYAEEARIAVRNIRRGLWTRPKS